MQFSILSDDQPSITSRFNTGSNGCQVFTFIVRRRGIGFVDLLKALKRFNDDLKRNTQKIPPPGVSFSKKEGGDSGMKKIITPIGKNYQGFVWNNM